MKRELITLHSQALGEGVNVIVYGEKGHPVIAFQAQDAKCNNYEDFGMVDTIADYLDNGTLQLFSVDNFDEESWSGGGDNATRAARQEAYFTFVTDELVPFVHKTNGSELRPLTTGCSMGGTHAAIAAFRRPDLFQGCIALSGVYDAHRFFGGWMDETLYNNSIPTFLANMPADHPYIATYAQRQLVLCVGQGAWEAEGMEDLRAIRDTCREKGIEAWCDFWGDDVYHDWPWWKKQIRYFLPIVLDDMAKTLAAEAEAAPAEEPAPKPARKRAPRKTAAKKAPAKAVKEEAAEAEAEPAKAEPAAEEAPAPKKTTRKRPAAKAAAKADEPAAAEAAAPAKKAPAKKTTTRKTATKKAPAKAAAAEKAPTEAEAPAKKAPAKRTTRRSTKKAAE